MRFSLDDLRLFLAIARSGSLAGAARILRVNHSTVFRRLKVLEAGLDARLFDRLPEGYVLTEAGEALRRHAERIEDEAQAIERQLSGQDVRLSGKLRLTTTDTLAGAFLAPILQAFHVSHPGVELDLLVTGSFLDLARRDADIAIRPTANPPDDLIGRRLGTIRWGVYGSPEYLQAHAPLADVTVAGDHRFIGGNDLIAHLASMRWLNAHVPPAAVVLRTNSIVAALHAARSGMGLAVLPHYMAGRDRSLRCVLAIGPEVATDLWLLVHPDLRRNARVQAFMSFIVTAMQGYRAELEGAELPQPL